MSNSNLTCKIYCESSTVVSACTVEIFDRAQYMIVNRFDAESPEHGTRTTIEKYEERVALFLYFRHYLGGGFELDTSCTLDEAIEWLATEALLRSGAI